MTIFPEAGDVRFLPSLTMGKIIVKFQNSAHCVNYYVMASLRKTLTKLPHLITFEAASRNLNFTRAAEELGVTRVSVSRQISELEEAVGAKLFNRDHRKVSLTQAGRILEAEVNPALHQIAAAVQRVSSAKHNNRLSLTTTSAFATYWLMPRLVDFKNLHPEIELNLMVSDRHLDLRAEGVDVAIRYTKERPNFPVVVPLMQEFVFPVVSPKYTARTQLNSAQDLLNEHLLHLSGIYRPGARWPNWFRMNGLQPPAESKGVVVNTYINMLQAAIEGQGIALAGYPLVDRYLEDGSLFKIRGLPEVARDYFYLIDASEGRSEAQKFCNWIIEASREEAHPGPAQSAVSLT